MTPPPQVTNALTYLHRKVGIVHQDLRCSNILVFKFPCLGHCCYQRSKFAGCDVCVKVTDMGISANPLVHRAGEAAGIKLLVPECLTANTVATLTEKVSTLVTLALFSGWLRKAAISSV